MLHVMSAATSGTWLEPYGDADVVAGMWREYDDAKTLLLLFIEMGAVDPSLFRASLVDSVRFYDLCHMPRGLGIKVRYIGSDANGLETGGVLSGVDFLGMKWTFDLASTYAADLIRLCSLSEDKVERAFIIFVSELLIVVALAAQFGHTWTGFVVASLIDNDNANVALGSRRSRNPYVRYLLLFLCLLEFKYKFRLVAFYVNTKTNWFLDFIGWDIDLSRADAREVIQRDLVGVHMPGLVFEKMSTLLSYFVGGDTMMRTLELPGDAPGGLGSKLLLSLVPVRREV